MGFGSVALPGQQPTGFLSPGIPNRRPQGTALFWGTHILEVDSAKTPDDQDVYMVI